MKEEDLDGALSEEIHIAPSPGFVSGVMAAVHREASEPSPIPFPWTRALPGFLAGAFALAMMIAALVKSAGHPASVSPAQGWLFSTLTHAAAIANVYGIGWILLTILVTAACVTFSMRLIAPQRS